MKNGGGGGESLATVRILYRTVVIDVCLFLWAVVFPATYFRFLFVKPK
jgi:hypothetical protein